MITGIPSLLLHLLAIGGVFALLVNLALHLLRVPLLQKLESYRPAARRRWLWCLALLPMTTGLVAVLLVMLPSIELALFADCPGCHVHDDGREHLCWYHPMSFHLASWQNLFLLALGVLLLRNLLRVLRSTALLAINTRRLLAFADTTAEGYTRLDSDVPCAVTLGLLKPRSLISSAIETALSPDELAIVVAHEQEHARNLDPLKQLLFRMLSLRGFVEAMELAVEQCADLAVTRRVRDRALIAATILKVRRLSEGSPMLINGPGVSGFNASILEQRIAQLLRRREGLGFPALKLFALFALVVFAGVLSGDATHHAVEFLLAY